MHMRAILAGTMAILTLAGCATPLSYREKGFVTGAAIGGGTGYLIGTRTGHPNLTAGIGAGIGALTGAIIGSAIDGVRQAPAPSAPAPSGAVATPPMPPQVTQPGTPILQVPGAYAGDPTAGTFVNGTPWLVKVEVDGFLAGAQFNLGPGQAQPANLDVGSHRIVAEGWVSTALGPRLVGRYDHRLNVDPRGSGWTLQFDRLEFR